MAAVFNVAGGLTGSAVASTVGQGIVPTALATQQLVVAALLSAIAWNLVTWWLGLPTSSSHALVFSLVGAGIAAAGVGPTRRASAVRWGIAGRIVAAWVVTIPVCVAAGWAFYWVLHLVTGAD